jgi:SHAQKYF class myb-like DNA-binding protein
MSQDPSEASNSVRRGHWSKEEHARFVQGIQLYGRNWKRICEYVGTRTSNQIRSHAQKYFIKLEKQNKFPNTQPELPTNACLLYMQALSYNTYMKLVKDFSQNFNNRPGNITRPVTIIGGEEDGEAENEATTVTA